MLFRLQRLLAAGLVALILAGCGGAVGELRESREPLVRRARDLRNAGDIDGAITSYVQALDRRGDMPQSHFELAAIYHQNKRDYVRAIYHYQRYLELDPHNDKTNIVAMEIRRARMEYAASLPERPSDAVQTIAAMAKERDLLRTRIAQLQAEVDRSKAAQQPAAVAAPAAPSAGAPPAPRAAATPPVAPELYVVKQGDTLAKIARGYYGDAGMANAIFEANRDQLRNENDLKVGQKIKLPPRRPGGG